MPSASLRGIGRPFKAPAGLASAAATSPTDPSQTTPDGGPSGAAATTATATADDSTAADADLPTPSDTDPSPTNGDSLPPVSSSSSLPATTTNGLIVPTTTNANSLSPSSSAASVSEKPSKFGILSRLNIQLPGRRSNRHIVDFHILPDEPHKQYVSGDSVRGSVVLAIVKPVRITHLVVTLHGYVHVYKDPSVVRSQTATITPRGGSSTLPQYHGNGVASLFQDEQVLSGDGRLEAGRYEFGFDLLFPDKSLPSSIEFERGTIAYMITATLTRPTTIAPTMSCERRVMLAQHIDVGDVPPPRPRTIFLEPISKRSRKKRTATSERSKLASQESQATEVGSEVGTDPSVAGDASRESATEHRSGTDGRSEFSGESNRSVSTGMSRSELSTLSNVTSTKQQAVDDKTITATIELLKGGYMPGDTVTIRVTVQHIKHLKSMNGVIVTLYRQGKIDSAPSATLFTGNGDKALDEAYPRSRTGLAGLSISSTSSRSMFRKDLDQNTVPLIIDPITLHATVTVTLKLPDNCFPSIKGVPGGMIGFKYQVEVIVDLGGRLSSQITQGGTSSTRYGSFGANGAEQTSVGFGPRTATTIMDTTPLRRQKGVISVSMELIVGTQDSSRTRKQAALRKRVIRIADGDEPDETAVPESAPSSNGPSGPPPLPTPNSRPPYSAAANTMLPSQAGPSSAPSYPQQNGYFNDTVPAYIPRPQMPSQSNISEKDRIRQAETRLLPSQPLAPAEASSSSAPPEDDLYSSQDAPDAPPADLLPSAPSAADAGPSAPTLDEVVSPAHPTEDKQELERRRLIDEASAPPEVPDDVEQHQPDAPSAPDLDNAEPSAPVLNEDDDFESFGIEAAGPSNAGPSTNGEQLPAYQR